jgi:D-aminopeptidase
MANPSRSRHAGGVRAADLGISIGQLPRGRTNSVLDVAGVGLGHATIWRDDPPWPDGPGVARTGVTVLHVADDLFSRPAPAGGAILNGCGECTGFIALREWGTLETPVFLTSTMQVGRVYDAACQLLVERHAAVGVDDVVVPVVAECDDSFLSDPRTIRVTVDDVRAAWESARASVGGDAVEQGAVGAGTGMSALGFKAGIGTSSRVLPDGQVLASLVLANFGGRERLTIAGVPVGRLLGDVGGGQPATPPGSCIVVLVTDARIDAKSCDRLARRAGLGLARVGSTASHGSGEIFLAVATGLRAARGEAAEDRPVAGRALDDYFTAAVDATEEAVLDALLAAPTVVGRDGNVSPGLPVDEVRRLLAEHGAVDG